MEGGCTVVLHGYGLTASGEPGRAVWFLDEARERWRPPPELVVNSLWLEAAEAAIRLGGSDRDDALELGRSVLGEAGRFSVW